MAADSSCTAPSHSYLRFQRAGQKALKEGRFESAKRAFDQALLQAPEDTNNNSSILIGVLDLRVEAQLKLKDLDATARNARKMVQHDRADPRGYLRCGQMARLTTDFAGAQRWYQRGLKNVSSTHGGYQKLAVMNSKTVGRSLAPRKKLRDPLIILPMDLICMVFDYLDLWEATSCLRVSRTWHNTLLAIHAVWKTLDLLGTRKGVVLSNVKACVRRLPSTPTTVRLDKLTVAAADYLRPYLMSWIASIEHLTVNLPHLFCLNDVSTVSTTIKSLHVGPKSPVYFKSISDLLHRCKALQDARFDAVRRGLPTTEPSNAVVEHNWPTHQETMVPELSHLELTARLSLAEEGYGRLIDPVSLSHRNLFVG